MSGFPPDDSEAQEAASFGEAEVLDPGSVAPVQDPQLRPYDKERTRETTRVVLAVVLVVLWAVVVVLPLWQVAVRHTAWSDLEPMVAVLLPAVTGIVGSAVGFYFGAEKGKDP